MFSNQQEIFFTVVTIVGALITVFTIFLIFTTVTQRKVVALQKKLLKAEILSIEKERERVASDLHDSLGSTLYALAVLNEQVQTANEESAKLNKDITAHLRDANEQIRQISRDLIPRFYAETTVEEVVLKASGEFEVICKEKGIQLIVSAQANLSLSKEDHLHIFRIVHELLNNGYKHSQASIITMSCLLKDQLLMISYNDNGVGYDAQTQNEGLGLSNIQNRISLLNGTHSVQTSPGKGTEILLRIPV